MLSAPLAECRSELPTTFKDWLERAIWSQAHPLVVGYIASNPELVSGPDAKPALWLRVADMLWEKKSAAVWMSMIGEVQTSRFYEFVNCDANTKELTFKAIVSGKAGPLDDYLNKPAGSLPSMRLFSLMVQMKEEYCAVGADRELLDMFQKRADKVFAYLFDLIAKQPNQATIFVIYTIRLHRLSFNSRGPGFEKFVKEYIKVVEKTTPTLH